MRSLMLSALTALTLAACGGAPQAAAPTAGPTNTAVVITQVVRETVVVTEVVTEIATVVVTATPSPAPATATPLPAAGKWQVSTDTSSFDDSTTVVLLLDAENEIEGMVDPYRPTLILRCQEGETDAYVVTGMAADVEYGNLDGATARVRFGSEAAETFNMGKSTDDQALFFPRPKGLIDRMAEHERMVFGFTPFNASPVEVIFDLRGLPEVLPQLQAVCP